MSLVFVC